MAVDETYVSLVPGVVKRLHFKGVGWTMAEHLDSVTKVMVRSKSLRFAVDREDGVEVSKIFGTMSSRLQGELTPYLDGDRYKRYEFTIVKDAPGFVSPRIVQATPI